MSFNPIILLNSFKVRNPKTFQVGDDAVSLVRKVTLNNGLERTTSIEVAGGAGVGKMTVIKGNLQYDRYENRGIFRTPIENGKLNNKKREVFCPGGKNEKPHWEKWVDYLKTVG